MTVATVLWTDRAGNRHAADRQQLVEMKLQADAEHQEDDADLGQLFGHRRIDGKSGCVRTEQRAGDQIADDRRQAQPLRDVAEHERAGKPPVSVRIRSYSCTRH